MDKEDIWRTQDWGLRVTLDKGTNMTWDYVGHDVTCDVCVFWLCAWKVRVFVCVSVCYVCVLEVCMLCVCACDYYAIVCSVSVSGQCPVRFCCMWCAVPAACVCMTYSININVK